MNDEKKKAVQALKTAKGQIEGIIKMVESGRYCIDISNQIMASQALLKRANKLILTQHMHGCVEDAINGKTDAKEKTEELIKILNKLIDKE